MHFPISHKGFFFFFGHSRVRRERFASTVEPFEHVALTLEVDSLFEDYKTVYTLSCLEVDALFKDDKTVYSMTYL